MIIAVNGHSSSGKTTLSRRLRAALPGSDVLHTDDIAWHQGVFGWDVLLINDVLPVIRSGRPLHYRPPAWAARGREGAVEICGDLDYLIIEGVGASQLSVRAELDAVIWVETDEPTRAARTRRRITDGEDSPSGYLGWMAEENPHVVEYEPWQDADFVIDGGDSVDHDRETEVVLAAHDFGLSPADWTSLEGLGRIRELITSRIAGWVAPVAWTVVGNDADPVLNRSGGRHGLASAALASVIGHNGTTATVAISQAQLVAAIALLSQAEACPGIEHPNLIAWRVLLSSGRPTFHAVFISDSDSPPTSPHDEHFRRLLAP